MTDRLAELRELEKAATPGPWRVQASDLVYQEPLAPGVTMRLAAFVDATDADEALVAVMRNALPDLLAVVEAARVVSATKIVSVAEDDWDALDAALTKLDGDTHV